jgi:hypothetical protein
MKIAIPVIDKESQRNRIAGNLLTIFPKFWRLEKFYRRSFN